MLPNMLRNLFAEGILSQAFVPVYSESLKVSEEKAKKDSGKIILFLSLVLSIIVFLGIMSFPYLLPYYVGKPQRRNRIVDFVSTNFIWFYRVY
jgi:Uncharacterized membrane protein, putative virulence factor